MDPETWKAFCRMIVSMGCVKLSVDTYRELVAFQCSSCGMEWKTAMKLEGVVHRALLNKCGGTWKIAEPAREQTDVPSVAPVEGSPAPINIGGETYEIEE